MDVTNAPADVGGAAGSSDMLSGSDLGVEGVPSGAVVTPPRPAA